MSKRLKQEDIDTYRRSIIRMLYICLRLSYADIGRIFRISRQRVEQIIKKKDIIKERRENG
jgi:DNA-directed RNA polymerase sigma subunit (sigma70/sigma32)